MVQRVRTLKSVVRLHINRRLLAFPQRLPTTSMLGAVNIAAAAPLQTLPRAGDYPFGERRYKQMQRSFQLSALIPI